MSVSWTLSVATQLTSSSYKSSGFKADINKTPDVITEERWKLFCKQCELLQHKSLISESDTTVSVLLSLIVEIHQKLDPQTCHSSSVIHHQTPVVNGVHANADSNSVVVEWEGQPPRANNCKYHIRCDSINESRQVDVKLDDLHYRDNRISTRIIRLTPWEKYQFRVCVEDSVAGMGKWSKPTKEVQLNKFPPPNPTEVSVSLTKSLDIGSDKLQLAIKINQPQLDHCELVEEYELKYQDKEGKISTYSGKLETNATYNATIVLPFPRDCNFWGFWFSLKNKYGWSLPSNVIRASDLKPSKAQDFTYIIDTITKDSVELLWEEPFTNSAIVEHYELEWWTLKKTENTKEMFYTIHSLHPNTDYCFRVYPITKFGKHGESSKELVIKTKPAAT